MLKKMIPLYGPQGIRRPEENNQPNQTMKSGPSSYSQVTIGHNHSLIKIKDEVHTD